MSTSFKKAAQFGPLIVMLLLIIIPFLGAALYYKSKNKFDIPVASHGVLLQPTLKIDELNLYETNGNQLLAKNMAHKWHILIIQPTSCQLDCQKNLQTALNIQIALGKHQSKVVVHAIKSVKNHSLLQDNHLFIVDPLGQIILHYSSILEAKGILQDLQRLLKLSHVK